MSRRYVKEDLENDPPQTEYDAVADELKTFADAMESWAREHIALDGGPTGRASFYLRGLNLQPLLDEFAADPDLNSHGPVWTAFAFDGGFDDRMIERLVTKMPNEQLAHEFSWGPRLDYHQIYKVARRLDVLLIHQVTKQEYVLGKSVNGGGIPAAGLLAVFRYEIFRCARNIREFAHDVRCFKETRSRDFRQTVQDRLDRLEDVAGDWESFYGFLKGGNVCGLRNASSIEELQIFKRVLQHGINVLSCAELEVPVTSSIAVDFARLKRQAESPTDPELTSKDEQEPLSKLTGPQERALEYIRDHGPVRGKAVADHIKLSFEHVRKWFTANGCLTAHGVVNDRNGDGYYVKP